MVTRLFVLSVCFAATAAYTTSAMQPEIVPVRVPLAELPYRLGPWTGQDAAPFSAEVLAVLGVDEHISRVYVAPKEAVASLYLGYYNSQRQGDAIHSPMNCLPGAGWEPVQAGQAAITVAGRPEPIVVNKYLIQKGADRQVVLYWYQSHGRIVASEYWSKAYMVYDAVRLNRTDAALVRVISPVMASESDAAAATERVTSFVQEMFPQLGKHLPS